MHATHASSTSTDLHHIAAIVSFLEDLKVIYKLLELTTTFCNTGHKLKCLGI